MPTCRIKKIRIAVVLLALAVLAGCAVIFGTGLLHASPSPAVPADTNATLTAICFYGNGCSHCEKIKPLITDIQARYPELHIEMQEINDNRQNLNKFMAMGSQYGLSSSALVIPTIFIGENVLVGKLLSSTFLLKNIGLQPEISSNKKNAVPDRS